MDSRKYFKYKVDELEELYASSIGDIGLLEELEEELLHRSTQRARKLLVSVKKSLEKSEIDYSTDISTEVPPTKQKPTNTYPDNGAVIDWETVLELGWVKQSKDNLAINSIALLNKPEDILDAWMAFEALSPQSYKKTKDLITGNGSVAYLNTDDEPWVRGEKSRPNNNLYYVVYLGAIDLEKATNKLLKLYQDKRAEFPQSKGYAAIGAILLDQKGIPIPDTGLALSSFSWAYATALKGNLSQLKSWDVAENALKEGLEKVIYPHDEEGTPQAFSLIRAQHAYQWLLQNCGILEEDSISPNFAIRLYQPFSKGVPEPPILNSFYLDDLQKAKMSVQSGACNKALSQYLGIEKTSDANDILKDKSFLEDILQPKYMPLGRWPSRGRHALVLLQQAAVNFTARELKQEGLFSVNGPPGTGKTTLLRDIVAKVVIDRSKALSDFSSPEDAFTHVGQMKLGGGFVHLYKLHDSVRGHEILVASSNNKAVENVSKELPLKEQVAEDIDELNYFKTVSSALADGVDTWGLIAAVLGNSSNRGEYINKAWWDFDTGLKGYFLSITGQPTYETDTDGNEKIPRVIQECDPPKNLEEAKRRWTLARAEFNEALERATKIQSVAQKTYEMVKHSKWITRKLQQLREEQTAVEEKLERAVYEKTKISSSRDSVQNLFSSEKDKENAFLRSKPSFFKRFFAWSNWKQWKKDHQLIRRKLQEIELEIGKILKSLKSIEDSQESFANEKSQLNIQEHNLSKEYLQHVEQIKKASTVCGDKLATGGLWEKSHEEQQKHTPNYTDEANKLRDDLFVAAIKLHKAFIDASAKQFRQNLAAYFYCLGGGSLQQDKQHLLPDLWSTAFLLTPVKSTAFASVARMLKKMPQQSIGWLLIDEAGQATPQAAIGAIHRAKRVISVGDPLQIEPVVTLPTSIVEGISRHMGVDPDHWMAPEASVQSIADVANVYGTTIPKDLSEIRIGAPLLVHRRCEDPMFTISNRLAYNGLMVQAKVAQESEISKLYGYQSAWFDIKGSAEEKWSPEEGEFVCDMLLRAFEHFNGDPDIFVITPFRQVAYNMRKRMENEKGILSQYGFDVSDWIENNIGTVHTFQGKEARGVILLLGAPSPSQNGARNWATSTVNLLNVAVSRAKQNFYVVGNKALWGEQGHMKLVNRYLK